MPHPDKKRLTGFWKRWDPYFKAKSVDWWIELHRAGNIKLEVSTGNRSFVGSKQASKLLRDFTIKLVLEKRMTEDECNNIHNMLQSSDNENFVVAITILYKLRKSKFKAPSNYINF